MNNWKKHGEYTFTVKKIEITRVDLRLKVCHILPKQKYFFPTFTDKVIFSGANNSVNFPPNNSFRPFKTDKKVPYTLMNLMWADPFWRRCVICVFQLRYILFVCPDAWTHILGCIICKYFSSLISDLYCSPYEV